MRRTKRRKNKEEIDWILDECLNQNKATWSTAGGNVKSLKELNLLSTADSLISKTLDTRFSSGKVLLTANKRIDESGDYFRVSKIQGLVKFSSDIKSPTEQLLYLKKFKRMVKNQSKLLGAEVTITKCNIIYVKGSKTKIVNFASYI